MKKIVLPGICAVLLLASCQQTKKDMLVGKWHAVDYENPELHDMFAESEKIIDTIGSNGNAMTNFELYNTTNIDSLRAALRQSRDEAMQAQLEAIKNTTFDFGSNNKLMVNFSSKLDTGNWKFFNKEQTELELEELTGPDKGRKTRMDILKLKADTLVLKIIQDTTYTIITFNKEKK